MGRRCGLLVAFYMAFLRIDRSLVLQFFARSRRKIHSGIGRTQARNPIVQLRLSKSRNSRRRSLDLRIPLFLLKECRTRSHQRMVPQDAN